MYLFPLPLLYLVYIFVYVSFQTQTFGGWSAVCVIHHLQFYSLISSLCALSVLARRAEGETTLLTAVATAQVLKCLNSK